MRLADDIVIELAGETIALRPSLREAIRLERRSGSFANLIADIQDGSLTAACDCIRPHYDSKFLATKVFDALDKLQVPLTEYVLGLTGIDPDAKPGNGGNRVAFSEHLTNLYKIATGWLGWTPDQALDASPPEIMLAYEGRVEMLKAIFGGNDDKPANDKPLDDKLKEVLSSFKPKKVQPKRKRALAA